jgi:pimeloyl-ACP methyl ester carboxylesterase
MVNIQERTVINGVAQFVSIRSNADDTPLLLYLHGGPGDAALPLVQKYNGALAQHFTVAVWEQRGAGKSYYPFADGECISIDTYVQDARRLIEHLLKTFRQEKIFLVGHSWGSVLGLLLCKEYPHLVRAYIGCGQVVNMQKSSRIAYEFAMQHATGRARERLAQVDCSYTGEQWLKDLLFTTNLVVKHGGSLYGASNYNRFVWDFIRSKDYTLQDLLCRGKGARQSIQHLWPELMGVSFENTTAFEMPVAFVEGRQDYHVSSQLVEEYYAAITTPKQLYWFERSAHFPQWSEADRFNQIVGSVFNAG